MLRSIVDPSAKKQLMNTTAANAFKAFSLASPKLNTAYNNNVMWHIQKMFTRYLLLNKIKIEPPGSSSSSSDSSSSSLRLLASVLPSKASPEPISAIIQLMRSI